MIAKVESFIECRVSSISRNVEKRNVEALPYLARPHSDHPRIFSYDKRPLLEESTTRAHLGRREEASTNLSILSPTIRDEHRSTHLVRVEDVVLRLHGRMASVAAV